MEENCCISEPSKLSDYIRRYYYSFWFWIYVNVWCRHFYRHVMRLLHKFNLHYAPPIFMEKFEPNKPYRQHWCQWCGLRGDVVKTQHYLDINL